MMKELRTYLEANAAKMPISLDLIKRETGVDYNEISKLVQGHVLIESWARKNKCPGTFEGCDLTGMQKRLLPDIMSMLADTPKSNEQIAHESNGRMNSKDVHYVLASVMRHGQITAFFQIAPKEDCNACFNRAGCSRLRYESERWPCNYFCFDWRLGEALK
jgi:hypothetical protein